MNKKIASELAIGIILLIAIIVGGIFWVSKQKQSMIKDQPPQAVQYLKKKPIVKNTDQIIDSCKSHYYEGESKVHGWIASTDQNDEKSIIVRIKNEDVKDLPIKNTENSENFTVKLIDPTEQVKNSLSLATEEKPTELTLKGYAEICQQAPPQVSLQQATVAFKKG